MASREDDELESRAPRRRRRSPATTPEARENELIAMAFDHAEKQFREGSASSQVTVHYLKLGSTRERLEQQRLEGEVRLLRKKIEDIDNAVEMKDLMQMALRAFKGYSGDPDPEDDYQE